MSVQARFRGVSTHLRYCHGETEENLKELCRVDGTWINPEKVGCMCGTILGMYATGNGTDLEKEAAFDWFRYEEK